MEYSPTGYRGDPAIEHTNLETIPLVTVAANISHVLLTMPATAWLPGSESFPTFLGGMRMHEMEAIIHQQRVRARPRWQRKVPSYLPYLPDRKAHSWHLMFQKDLNRKRNHLWALGGMLQTERTWS